MACGLWSADQDLALYVIGQHLGSLAKHVAKQLLLRPGSTVAQLQTALQKPEVPTLRSAGHIRPALGEQQVVDGLVVLITHNVVGVAHRRITTVSDTIGSKKLIRKNRYTYTLCVRSAVLRLAFPLFLAHVAGKHGARAERLVAILVEYGRLPLKELLRIYDETLDEEDEAGAFDAADAGDTLEELVLRLVHERLISKPHLLYDGVSSRPPDAAHSSISSALQRTTRKPKEAKKDDAAADATATEAPASTPSSFDEPYRINCGQFLYIMQVEESCAMVGKQYGAKAQAVMQCMLQQCSPPLAPFEASAAVREETDRPILGSIRLADLLSLPKVREAWRGGDGDEGKPTKLVQTLCGDSQGIVKQRDQTLYPDLNAAVEVVQRRVVESVLMQRFGTEGLRVFRMLLKNEKMQPEQIAAAAMMNQKAVHALLGAMYDAGLVELQEVPQSADFALKSMFFLYHVNYERAVHRIRADMCLTMKRLALRFQSEVSLSRPLVEKMKKLHSQEGESVSGERLSQKERGQLARLEAVQIRLEACILRLVRSYLIVNYL